MWIQEIEKGFEGWKWGLILPYKEVFKELITKG